MALRAYQDEILQQSLENTYQVLPNAQENGAMLYPFFGVLYRGPLLAPWGTRQREIELRRIYRQDYNWAVQGAFSGIANLIASTPWEVKGPEQLSSEGEKLYRTTAKALGFQLLGEQRTDIEYWQQLLRQADFAGGWTRFIRKGVVDYLRQDTGWLFEIIAPGDPKSEPTGPAMGIAHLDAVRCVPTGDPEFPILYVNRNNEQRLIFHKRICVLQDMPDGDEARPGYGLSALSRAISISSRFILTGRYIESSLDDKPKPGIVVTNMAQSARERALVEYNKEQNADERPIWGKQLWFYHKDVNEPMQFEVKAFSEAPEKFDYKTYTEVDINALALAIGVDVQELWQLTSGNLGTGTQSEILHAKSRGKTIGILRTEIERKLNDILPAEYEFAFKYRDAQEDQATADRANAWAGFVSSVGATLTPDEQRAILANQVEAVKDAITDSSGQIIRLHDADVQPQEEMLDDNQSPFNALGGVPVGMPGDGAQTLLQGLRSQPDAPPGVDPSGVLGASGHRPETGVARTAKDIQATELDFEAAFADSISAAKNDDLSRRRFGIVARALIARFGKMAYKDGLTDGGLEDDELSDADLDVINTLISEQSSYVTAFADALFDDGDPDPDSKAEIWFNKSVMPFYQRGLESADTDGLYEWVYGDTEHCEDCLRLNGQKHRLSGWLSSGYMPQGDGLACNGFNCKCGLEKTTGRARGSY